MSGLQKAFLIGACVSFAATIYSLFFLNLIFIVICFLVHCLCLFAFCYVCYSDQLDKELSLKTYHQEVGIEIAEKEKKLAEIFGQMKKKDSLIEQFRGQAESLRTQNESIKDEASGLHARIRRLEEEKLEKERELQMEREKDKHAGKQDIGALRWSMWHGKTCARSQVRARHPQ